LQALITHSCRLIEFNMVEDHSLHTPATDIKTANKEIKNRHQLVLLYMVLQQEEREGLYQIS